MVHNQSAVDRATSLTYRCTSNKDVIVIYIFFPITALLMLALVHASLDCECRVSFVCSAACTPYYKFLASTVQTYKNEYWLENT